MPLALFSIDHLITQNMEKENNVLITIVQSVSIGPKSISAIACDVEDITIYRNFSATRRRHGGSTAIAQMPSVSEHALNA